MFVEDLLCSRYYNIINSTYIKSFHLHNNLLKEGVIFLVPILQLRKLKFRKLNCLAQGHTINPTTMYTYTHTHAETHTTLFS